MDVNTKIGIGIVSGIAAIGITLFLAIPIKGEMRVQKTRWEWDIPTYKYTMFEESNWDTYPEDAYDVRPRREVRRRDEDDNPIYDWKFYYKINKWSPSASIGSMGYDKSPYEYPCDIPYSYDNPQLGDVIRGAHYESYYVVGIIGDNRIEYKISKSDWLDLNPEDKITYKKYRFGKKIWDIQYK